MKPCLAWLSAALFCVSGNTTAQDLAPRGYWPTPKDLNVFVLGYQYTTGDVVVDASLPLPDVSSAIHNLQLSYQRTISVLDRTATVQVSLPFSQGDTEGFVNGEFRQRSTNGMGDVQTRFSINLKGAPSMDGKGFQALRRNPTTIIGASLIIQAPTGDYDSDKVINLGTNRWSVKPALGLIWPLRPTWLLEVEAGAWFFGDNDNFLGETRKQDPIIATEVNLIKRVRPGFWASIGVNFYDGGRTSVNGNDQPNLQRNSRIGATVVFPIRGRHALRGSVSTPMATKSGGDFDKYTLSYFYAW